MRRILIALSVLVLAGLACGMPAVVPPDPEQSDLPYVLAVATPTIITIHTETLVQTTILTAVTDTNVRDCASMGGEIVGMIYEGETVTAVCNGAWCYSQRHGGWFCQAALIGTGGCE